MTNEKREAIEKYLEKREAEMLKEAVGGFTFESVIVATCAKPCRQLPMSRTESPSCPCASMSSWFYQRKA